MLDPEQVSIILLAEIDRFGSTQGTCASLYALAIGAAHGDGADYWLPINESLKTKFGPKGREHIKRTAWEIHDHAARALKAHADA